jgi:hypothetical protein
MLKSQTTKMVEFRWSDSSGGEASSPHSASSASAFGYQVAAPPIRALSRCASSDQPGASARLAACLDALLPTKKRKTVAAFHSAEGRKRS